jgi:hypothetical protein
MPPAATAKPEFGLEAANLALARVRAAGVSLPLGARTELARGVWFSLDTEGAEFQAQCDLSGPGLMTVEMSATRPGRWCTLNIDLGPEDLSLRRVLGLAIRLRAPSTTTLRASLRSFRAGAFQDIDFPLPILAHAEDSTHTDVLWTARHPGLTTPADWRSLLVFFQPGDFRVTISDLVVLAN